MADIKGKKPPGGGKPPASPANQGPPGPPMDGPPPGAADPMATGMGVQPPMPGSGVDPYAALAGQISNIAPMGMPMGQGQGQGQGPMPPAPLQGGPPVDPMQHALMSDVNPMAMPPDIGQTWADPSEDAGQNMSFEQILQLLSLMQAGIPGGGGAAGGGRPGSMTAGMVPPGIGGSF